MTKIKNYTIGSDFELFLLDTVNFKAVNAKPYVKGSKHKPYNFDPSSPFWCTSLDNVSFEGNIPPATSAEEFSGNILKVITYLKGSLPENIIPIHECAVRFDDSELQTREAKTFGCESSLNAYTKSENPRPSGENTNLRTTCTHVHIKYDDMDFDLSCELVKALDLFLGIPSLAIEPLNERRSLYGTLGEMRYSKTTEYRVLSSFFSQSDELRKWVYNNTVEAINWINAGNAVTDEMTEMFQQAMSTNDIELANKIIKENNIPMPQL